MDLIVHVHFLKVKMKTNILLRCLKGIIGEWALN
jgi:hypothetical protein